MGSQLRTPRTKSGLICFMIAITLACASAAMAGQSLFWLQTDGNTSRLGSVQNPQIAVGAGSSVPLYLWLDKDAVTYGFDGISLDVKLVSADGGAATATISFDEPAGRWHGTSGGATRTDSGGTGVDDCNAIDFTNTDTLTPDPLRLATLNITGVSSGTVQLFICVGGMGIADGGENAVVWMGLGNNSTAADTQLINGGIPGLCSSIPEATITVTAPALGDFDDDDDVDQEDFGHLQECFTGLTAQTRPECADTLLNADSFVDENDVALFMQCFSGPNILPPVNCR